MRVQAQPEPKVWCPRVGFRGFRKLPFSYYESFVTSKARWQWGGAPFTLAYSNGQAVTVKGEFTALVLL